LPWWHGTFNGVAPVVPWQLYLHGNFSGAVPAVIRHLRHDVQQFIGDRRGGSAAIAQAVMQRSHRQHGAGRLGSPMSVVTALRHPSMAVASFNSSRPLQQQSTPSAAIDPVITGPRCPIRLSVHGNTDRLR
jgi:hypothetical protein